MSESLRKILVVDDEQNMRIALFEALSRNGYEVVVAENGLMALDVYDKNQIDLVIADIKMPEMDGIELLGHLKAKNPALPVVIITGYATVDNAVEAMKRGAFTYLTQPFDSRELILQIERASETKRRPDGYRALDLI